MMLRAVVVSALVLGASPWLFAQSADPVRRTAWGDPDLQGVWPSAFLAHVPFERPEQLGSRTEFTAAEYAAGVAAREARWEEYGRTGIAYGLHWSEDEQPPPIASLVVDPPNGRLPPMTEEGARRAAEWRTRADPDYPYAGPEDLRPYDRCITRGVLGSAYPNAYGSVTWILQTPDHVIIGHEMIHEARVIPLDGRPHIAPAIPLWMGDSRGRWEGDTLVVETTNFNGLTGSVNRNGSASPSSRSQRLVERLRLGDADTLEYEVRVEDPETWTRPWTVAFPLHRDDDYVVYEYACHEANYALRNILSIARHRERRQAE